MASGIGSSLVDWLGRHIIITAVAALTLAAGLIATVAFKATSSHRSAADQESPGPTGLTDAEYLRQGTTAFAAGQWPAAVAALTQALQKNPRNDTARLLLARAYLGLRDGAAAENVLAQINSPGTAANNVVYLAQALAQQGKYRQLLDQAPPDPNLTAEQQAQLLTLRGQAYLYLGDLENARQQLEAAHEISPDETAVQLALARLRLAQGQPTAAAELARQALDAAPDAADGWSLLAELALQQGQMQAAENAYDKAIAVSNTSADNLINRALLRIQRGDYGAAAADLKLARSQAPNHAGALFAEGLMRFYQGDYADAWDRLGQAAQTTPDYPPGYFFLGLADYALGQWRQGEQNLASYLRAVPQDQAAALALAGGQVMRGDFAAAVAGLQSLLSQSPGVAGALELLGYLYLTQDNGLRSGGETLERAVALQSDAALLRARLGLVFWLTGRPEQAARQFEQAAALQPSELLTVAQALLQLQLGRYGAVQQTVEQWRAQQPNQALPEVLQGLLYQKLGKMAEAQAAFERALRLQPGHFAAAWGAVELALAQGQPERARDIVQQALQAQPDNPVYLLRLAALEYRLGRFSEAARRLTQLLERKPDAIAVRLDLARLLLQRMGQAREAVKILQQAPAVALQDQPALQMLLGQAQLAAGDWFEAAETLRALSWSQPSPVVHYLLATAYYGQNQPDAAQRELDKALAIDPNYPPAQLAKAHRLLAVGQLSDARVLLARLRYDRPNDINVINLEGELALAGKDAARAMTAFDRLRRLDPAAGRWALRLAQAQFAAGQTEAALATCQDWLTAHPADRAVYAQLARFYLLAGREADAAAAYAQLLEWRSDQPALLLNLAWLLRRSDPAKALAYAEQALKLQPGSAVFKGTLALLLLQQGKTERAAALLREALTDLSQNLSIQFQLTQALAQTGDKVGARRYLRRILDDPRLFAERPQAEALLKELAATP